VQLAAKGAAPGGVIAQVLEIQARVDAIDYKKRTMVLKGPEGNRVKLAVDPGVKRLNEVKVGDMVVVAYTEALAAEMIAQ
jgi:mannose/fructose/N-acetylgalactosamine-specific phosphotransferase system component IIB